jgi:hypothetical protein
MHAHACVHALNACVDGLGAQARRLEVGALIMHQYVHKYVHEYIRTSVCTRSGGTDETYR